jgi:hypothetical protein
MPYVFQTWCRAVEILVSSSFFEQMTFEQMTFEQMTHLPTMYICKLSYSETTKIHRIVQGIIKNTFDTKNIDLQLLLQEFFFL